MSQPLPFETQNVRDDDGQVIDSFLIETDSPPPIEDAKEPIVVRALPQPKIVTRMFSGEQSLNSGMTPVQILPADANRLSLNVYVYSPTQVATDGIRFSDENGNVNTGGKLLHDSNIMLAGHTGPVWVIDTGVSGRASAAVYVEYWSVTS